MAGSASNWFKPSSGPLKGQAVYLSKAQQGLTYMYKPSREAVLKMLSDPEHVGSAAMIARYANAQRPAKAAGGDRVRRPTSGRAGQAADPPSERGSNGQVLQADGRTEYGYARFSSDNVPIVSRVPGQPQAIVMAGLPASGKSTLRKNITNGDTGWDTVDADEIKKTIPGYDPKNPGAVHGQSMDLMFRQVETLRRQGKDFIWDITGTNPIGPSVVELLQEKGFKVTVVHVDADLETVRARNAARTRSVPDWVITSTQDMLPEALPALRQVADVAFAVDTNG
jgi:predicted kinase